MIDRERERRGKKGAARLLVITWWRILCGPGEREWPCHQRSIAFYGRHGTWNAWLSGAVLKSSRHRIPYRSNSTKLLTILSSSSFPFSRDLYLNLAFFCRSSWFFFYYNLGFFPIFRVCWFSSLSPSGCVWICVFYRVGSPALI